MNLSWRIFLASNGFDKTVNIVIIIRSVVPLGT